MFSSSIKYDKLKTNLRLAANRLKLLEKKKAELGQKSRKEIADYLLANKTDRARIRVEQIIREDYLVEAMEIAEMYCDTLLTRFSMITQMKEIDPSIAEPISSLIWLSPRIQSEIPELKVIAEIFAQKYGPQFTEESRTATGDHHVSSTLRQKLALQAPPKLLIENYLIEIANNFGVDFEPDPQVMREEQEKKRAQEQHYLIDLSDKSGNSGNSGNSAGAPMPMGFVAYPSLPPLPQPPNQIPFNYPYRGNGGGGGGGGGGSYPPATAVPPENSSNNLAADEKKLLNIDFINAEKELSSSNNSSSPEDNNNSRFSNAPTGPPPAYSSINPVNLQGGFAPKPTPRSKKMPSPDPTPKAKPRQDLPSLPNVPTDLPDIPNHELQQGKNSDDEPDFSDLLDRFEKLKKRK